MQLWKNATSGVALIALAGGCANASGQASLEAAQRQAEQGRAAAAAFPGLGGLCDLSMQMRDVNAPRGAGQGRPGSGARGERPGGGARGERPGSGARGERPGGGGTRGERPGRGDGDVETQEATPPMKVFDNLYFVGNAGVAAWVLGDEDGYILIDALTSNETAKSQIEGGMRALGLDPTKIKYLLITHAHGDHFGGYRYIVDTYKPRVVMSQPDWDLATRLEAHPRFGSPPPKDMVVKDGDVLKVGRSELEIRVTPGHTPGTISPLFTVYDNGKPHRAALWGGTGFNFGPDVAQLRVYAKSAQTYKALADRQGVDVFLSNHPSRDGSLDKMQRLAARKPSEPNPFVLGKVSLGAFDVLSLCASAQAERLSVKAEATP